MTIDRNHEEGLSRLIGDLETHLPPAHLKQAVLSRIEMEPARVETNREGAIISVNPAFTGLCGYEFSEIKGRKPGSFLQGKKTDPKTTAILRETVKTGKSCRVEIVNYHKDGSPYLVHIAVEPIHHNGEIIGFRAEETKLPLA